MGDFNNAQFEGFRIRDNRGISGCSNQNTLRKRCLTVSLKTNSQRRELTHSNVAMALRLIFDFLSTNCFQVNIRKNMWPDRLPALAQLIHVRKFMGIRIRAPCGAALSHVKSFVR